MLADALPNFNLFPAPFEINDGTNKGRERLMRALDDSEMGRLSDLLAQGQLRNAEEIAALLVIELGETPPSAPVDENLQAQLATLCQIASHL